LLSFLALADDRHGHARVDRDSPQAPRALRDEGRSAQPAVLRHLARVVRRRRALSHRGGQPRDARGYGRGAPNDWLERNLYSRHRYAGLLLTAVIDLVLFGLPGIAIYAVQMVWIPFWAAGVINGVGHYWGYRNFETQDTSRNIWPVGILIGGEEFHNNHHAYGSSAKFSSKWWELDIGWLYICALERLGLASIKKVAPRASFSRASSTIDLDTLRAVVTNRFYVMTLYGRRVIAPVLHGHAAGEPSFPRRQLARVRKLMIRENTGLREDPHVRQWLE